MNIENLIENIQSILECAEAIKDDAEANPPEGSDLYDRLKKENHSVDYDEIVAALYLHNTASILGIDCRFDAEAAFELWREWINTGLSEVYSGLDDVQTEIESRHDILKMLSVASGMRHVASDHGPRDCDIREAIEKIQSDGISPAEKALLTAVKAFIAATQE
tara:strand:+ start:427 stop:915 length:489 start_codon:yes stop_codon:yes gene_type:complete